MDFWEAKKTANNEVKKEESRFNGPKQELKTENKLNQNAFLQNGNTFSEPAMVQPKRRFKEPTPLQKNYGLTQSIKSRIVSLENLATMDNSSRMLGIIGEYRRERDVTAFMCQLSDYIITTKNNTIRTDAKELLNLLFEYTAITHPEIMADAIISINDELEDSIGSKNEKELHKKYDYFLARFKKYRKENDLTRYEEESAARIDARKKARLKGAEKPQYKGSKKMALAVVRLRNMAKDNGSARMQDIMERFETSVKNQNTDMGKLIRDLTWYVDTTKNKKLKQPAENLLNILLDFTMKQYPELMVRLQSNMEDELVAIYGNEKEERKLREYNDHFNKLVGSYQEKNEGKLTGYNEELSKQTEKKTVAPGEVLMTIDTASLTGFDEEFKKKYIELKRVADQSPRLKKFFKTGALGKLFSIKDGEMVGINLRHQGDNQKRNLKIVKDAFMELSVYLATTKRETTKGYVALMLYSMKTFTSGYYLLPTKKVDVNSKDFASQNVEMRTLYDEFVDDVHAANKKRKIKTKDKNKILNSINILEMYEKEYFEKHMSNFLSGLNNGIKDDMPQDEKDIYLTQLIAYVNRFRKYRKTTKQEIDAIFVGSENVWKSTYKSLAKKIKENRTSDLTYAEKILSPYMNVLSDALQYLPKFDLEEEINTTVKKDAAKKEEREAEKVAEKADDVKEAVTKTIKREKFEIEDPRIDNWEDIRVLDKDTILEMEEKNEIDSGRISGMKENYEIDDRQFLDMDKIEEESEEEKTVTTEYPKSYIEATEKTELIDVDQKTFQEPRSNRCWAYTISNMLKSRGIMNVEPEDVIQKAMEDDALRGMVDQKEKIEIRELYDVIEKFVKGLSYIKYEKCIGAVPGEAGMKAVRDMLKKTINAAINDGSAIAMLLPYEAHYVTIIGMTNTEGKEVVYYKDSKRGDGSTNSNYVKHKSLTTLIKNLYATNKNGQTNLYWFGNSNTDFSDLFNDGL